MMTTFRLLILFLALASVAPANDKPAPFYASQGGGPMLGVAPEIPAPPYRVRWRTRAGDDERRAPIENSPLIAAETVYVADGNGVLHAFDLANGKARWTFKAEGGFATTPLIVGNKVMLGDLDGYFHCVDAATGKKLWSFDSGNGIHASANLSSDGKAALFGNDSGEVFAVDIATGNKVWAGKGGDRMNACPGVGQGAAFFTGCDARLLALDLKTGQEKFTFELGSLAPGSPIILEDRIIAGAEGSVQAISPDGKNALWKYSKTDDENAMFYSSPAFADGKVVIGCRDRQVHAIDVKTGQRVWAYKTRGDVDAAITISGGRVYACSKDKKLHVLDLKTGKPLWEFAAPRAIEGGAAVGSGVVVLADAVGNIICLEPGKP